MARTEWGRRAMPGDFFVTFLERMLTIFLSHINAGRGRTEDIAHERRRTEGVGEDLAE